MKVLKATESQYNSLNGRVNGNSLLNFVKDADNNFIVGKEVLMDASWKAIRSDLEQLQEINFNPIVVTL